ncbi:uncharacterized protein [Amphiura filiformis]|uniref:uncharacterized protein n=1 Tax=Amphiura filiformis TaxID=82378 RepID=UPI003B21A250
MLYHSENKKRLSCLRGSQYLLSLCILVIIFAGRSTNGSFSGSPDQNDESPCGVLPDSKDGHFSCNRGNSHGSTCTFYCSKSGYSVCTNSKPKWKCENGDWNVKELPECCDTTAPLVKCPRSVTKIAADNEMSATTSWKTPKAADNSNVRIEVVLKSGLPSGSWFQEGQNVIEYEARDSAGNVATCSFNVIVEVRRCPRLLPNEGQLMSCNDFVYGSTCLFSCEVGWCLHGSTSMTCGTSSLDPDAIDWTNEQPTCEAQQLLIRFTFRFNEQTCLPFYSEKRKTRKWVMGKQIIEINNCNYFSIYSSLCPPLEHSPANSYVVNTCSNTIGSQCEFRCNSGYEMDGGNLETIYVCTQEDASSCVGYWAGGESQEECKDTTPPIISGPEVVTVIGQPGEAEVSLGYDWEPITANDTADSDVIVATLVNVDGIPLPDGVKPTHVSAGIHTLVYEAQDAAGNKASMTLEITAIEALTCKSLPAPENGFYSCLGNVCDLTCQQGYDIPQHLNRVFTCINDEWRPNDQQVPQCQLTHNPVGLKTTTNVIFNTTMDCTTGRVKQRVQQEMQNFVTSAMASESCCEIQDEIDINCEEAPTMFLRQKRDENKEYDMDVQITFTTGSNNPTSEEIIREEQALDSLINKIAEFEHKCKDAQVKYIKAGDIVPICTHGLTQASINQLGCTSCEAGSFEEDGKCRRCPVVEVKPGETAKNQISCGQSPSQ